MAEWPNTKSLDIAPETKRSSRVTDACSFVANGDQQKNSADLSLIQLLLRNAL